MDKDCLKQFIPINSLTSVHIGVLAEETRLENHPAGSWLFTQGDRDSDALFLLKGEVKLIAKDAKHPRLIEGGADSARYALSHLKPRQYSGLAASDVVVARVDGWLLDRLVTFEQALNLEAADFGEDPDQDWITRFLKGNAFHKLPTSNISALLARFQPIKVRPGQVIIRQGEQGEHYFVIKSGEADVLRKSNSEVDVVAQLSSGEGFGEEALLSDAPRNATVVMTTPGELMRLDRVDFDELLREPIVDWISPQAVGAAIKSGTKLIDVRLEDEVREGTIKGSLNLPLNRLREKMSNLDKNLSYIVFCQTGSRSCAAAFLLTREGFKASVLRGGLTFLMGQT